MSKKSGETETPFYRDKKAYRKSARFALLGCLFMFASIFLYWRNTFSRISEKNYSGISFFSTTRECLKMDKSLKTLILPVLLLLFFAVVVILGVAAFRDNISKKPFLSKYKKRMRFGLIALTIVLVIIMVRTPVFSDNLQKLESMHLTWKAYIDTTKNSYVQNVGEMYSYYTIGPGFIAYIIGIILYIISICYCFVLDTLNEDD